MIYKLGDLVENFDSKRIPLSSMQRQNMSKKYPYYGATGIFDYVDDYIFDGDYLLLAEDGTVLRDNKYPVLQKISGQTWINNHAHVLKAKEEIVLQDYLYYALYITDITPRVTGAVQLKLNQKNMNEIELEIPDLEIQKKIVRILSALDQKIELNNQESENLRRIIKTLYGNTATSNKEKAKLADLAKISSGKRPMSIETNGEYAVVGARDIMGFTNEYNQEPEVIITGRVGTLGVVKRYPKKTWASDNTLIVDTKYKNYIECYLSSVDFGAYNRGSTQPLITQTDLKNFVLPFNEEECNNFENKTAPLRSKMFAIEEQNEELIMLRDTLLPKLISGKININGVCSL